MIDKWLEFFCHSWKHRDIDAIMELFSDDIEYWESPYEQLLSLESVKEIWQAIHKQENIKIQTRVVMSQERKYLVEWSLEYTQDLSHNIWGGLYIIELDETGRCTYFYQVGEKKVV
ncbi:MAG: nuclear transport factor 2 family protein [Candidatus Saccharimonadales bacterium]